MKIAVIGTGAVGVWLAGSLAASEQSVCGLARGTTLANLKRYGWRILKDGRVQSYPAVVSESAAELGKQDVVILAVKNTALGAVVDSVVAMCHDDTVVLPALNGVPWWFLKTLPGWRGQPLEGSASDPLLAASIPANRILGCIINSGISSPEPGIADVSFTGPILLGDVTGGKEVKLHQVQQTFQAAGLPANTCQQIHLEVWKKLLLNLTFNALSALTRSSPRQLITEPSLHAFIKAVKEEVLLIAQRLGLPMTSAMANAILTRTAQLGDFKPSMQQDVEAGRPLEIEALLETPLRIAEQLDLAVPNVQTLYGMAKMLDSSTLRQAEEPVGAM